MDPILGVTIGLSMPMLFGFMLGYRVGKQAKSKEILEAMSRLTQRTPDLWDSAPSQALSTPDMFSAIEHEPTPAPRR